MADINLDDFKLDETSHFINGFARAMYKKKWGYISREENFRWYRLLKTSKHLTNQLEFNFKRS